MKSRTKTILTREAIDLLVKTQFGESARVSEVTELTEGWFNSVFVIEYAEPVDGRNAVVLKTGIQRGKYVLTYEKEIMRSEVFIYGLLEKNGIPAPRVLASDFSQSIVDFDYFFMEKLEGPSWQSVAESLTSENKAKLDYEWGRVNAQFHSIKGDYFGYIKDDPSYRFSTWREAFRSFIDNIVADGKLGNIDMPYGDVYEVFEPFWEVLDDVKEPSLVHFDMFYGNMHLAKKNDGEYTIDGIIDHERAFYGDPIADFISTLFLFGGVENAVDFNRGYQSVTGKPVVFGKSEQIRLYMYLAYLALIMGIEVYRYEPGEETEFSLAAKPLLVQWLTVLKGMQ